MSSWMLDLVYLACPMLISPHTAINISLSSFHRTFKSASCRQKSSHGISCTIALARLLNPAKPSRPLPSVQETGSDGLSIWDSSAYSSTHSLTTFCSGKDNEWLKDSFSQSEKDPFPSPAHKEMLLETIHNGFLAGASKKPLGTWLRNSGVTTSKDPFTSMKEPTILCPNSKLYSELGKT
jgi:hypothetical protein